MALPTTMTAVGLSKTGPSLDVIEEFKFPVPTPTPTQILIKVSGCPAKRTNPPQFEVLTILFLLPPPAMLGPLGSSEFLRRRADGQRRVAHAAPPGPVQPRGRVRRDHRRSPDGHERALRRRLQSARVRRRHQGRFGEPPA